MRPWMHYLTRPGSIFTSSLWREWYASERALEIVGVQITNTLFVEYPRGSTSFFFHPEEYRAYIQSLEDVVVYEPGRMKEVLEEGVALFDIAQHEITDQQTSKTFLETVDFFVRLGLQTAHLPRVTLNTLEKYNTEDQELFRISESLRSKTIYPLYLGEVVKGKAVRFLEEKGLKGASTKVDDLTYLDCIGGEFNVDRKRDHATECFRYIVEDGKEQIAYSTDNGEFLKELLKIPDDVKCIKGQIAFAGKHVGRARVVFDYTTKEFNHGDILVSVCSTPTLMPWIRMCGAMVTDEGGLGCHAAVISREFKKPCVIGTKIGTQAIQDGDLLEVDAEKGIVTILERKE